MCVVLLLYSTSKPLPPHAAAPPPPTPLCTQARAAASDGAIHDIHEAKILYIILRIYPPPLTFPPQTVARLGVHCLDRVAGPLSHRCGVGTVRGGGRYDPLMTDTQQLMLRHARAAKRANGRWQCPSCALLQYTSARRFQGPRCCWC